MSVEAQSRGPVMAWNRKEMGESYGMKGSDKERLSEAVLCFSNGDGKQRPKYKPLGDNRHHFLCIMAITFQLILVFHQTRKVFLGKRTLRNNNKSTNLKRQRKLTDDIVFTILNMKATYLYLLQSGIYILCKLKLCTEFEFDDDPPCMTPKGIFSFQVKLKCKNIIIF